VQLVNNLSTPILISIHQNKYPDGGPRGAQVLYRDDAESICFAGFVQGRLKEALKSNNVRPSVPIPDSIYLMRKVGCPAILVECGFLSNPEEEARLVSDEYQTMVAIAVTKGYTEYLRSS
jgi:N-acetylmuramoyl-L-alanine amidase